MNLRRLLLTVISTPAVALAVWALAVPLAGVTLTVRQGDGTQTIGPLLVAVVTLLAGLAGWALLAVLERWTARPARTWRIVALVVLAVSLLGPLGSAVGAAATLVLLLLHVAVGAVLVVGLVRR
ncbi:MAG: hypothetical protein HOW71_37825 [Nonomuraea sp.]|nr:hypothetical protein [Nonomuraea sp.]